MLHYALQPEPGRTVTFAERGARTYRALGTARHARGTIAFTPAAGRNGARQILALITEGGVQMRSLTVARYTVRLPTRAARPGRVRAVHRGATLTVSWARVAAAVSYEVIVQTADGEQTLHLVKGRSLRRRR